MPVSVVPSAEHTSKRRLRKSTVARKRRHNENTEIDELAALVPLATPLAPPDTSGQSLVPSSGKAPAIDKISVLRITSTFLKLQNFMKETSTVNGSEWHRSTNDLLRRLEEAIDGFLLVLDKDTDILYVSETISGYIGLNQQDVIGQNLDDITHSDSASTIASNLRPTVIPTVSMETAGIKSQFRQFYVKFKSTSKFHTQTVVRISGNLKVMPPPSKTSDKADEEVDFVEPSVVGFVGECHVIESVPPILQMSFSHSTFIMLKNAEHQMTYIEASFKEIFGHDPQEFVSNPDSFKDFIHPGDYDEIQQCAIMAGMIRDGFVTPYYRVITSSGDWTWMQSETVVHYKKGTLTPHIYEYKCRVLSQGGGKTRCLEFPIQSTSSSNSGTKFNPSLLRSSHALPSTPSSSLSSLSSPASNTSSAPSPTNSGQCCLCSSMSSPAPPSVTPVSPQTQTNSLPSLSRTSSSASPASSSTYETTSQATLVPNLLQTTIVHASPPVPSPLQTTTVHTSPQAISQEDVLTDGMPLYNGDIPIQSCGNILGTTAEVESSRFSGYGCGSIGSASSASPSNASVGNGSISIASISGTPSPYYGSDVSAGSVTFVSSPEIASQCNGGAQSDFSFPFQTPPSSNSIPEPSANDFNHHIPPNFNFFDDASSFNGHGVDSTPMLDFSLLDNPLFDGSTNPAHTMHSAATTSSDSVLQQLLGEIIALNGDSDFSDVTSRARQGEMNSYHYSQSGTFSMPSQMSNSSILFQGLQSTGVRNSSSEVQDGLQQYM